MRRVNEFHTTDPVKLARELPDLEDNVDRAIAELQASAAPKLVVDSFQPLGNVTIVSLVPDHQLSIDTTQANAIAVLPALSPENFGKRFALIKRLPANQIVVTCQEPTTSHNGVPGPASFPTIAAAGVRLFYCDSAGYYS